MSQCNPKYLFESETLNIIYCPGCGGIGMVHKSVLLHFSEFEFKSWVRYIKSEDVYNRTYCSGGEKKVLVATPKQGLNLMLKNDELLFLRGGVSQSLLLLESYELLGVQ